MMLDINMLSIPSIPLRWLPDSSRRSNMRPNVRKGVENTVVLATEERLKADTELSKMVRDDHRRMRICSMRSYRPYGGHHYTLDHHDL